MKIEVGQIIKANYGIDKFVTGPFKVLSVIRGCTCKAPLDFFENGPDMPPHLHMRLEYLERENRGEAWLNYFDEETLKSVAPGSTDEIILCENPVPIQQSLAF